MDEAELQVHYLGLVIQFLQKNSETITVKIKQK